MPAPASIRRLALADLDGQTLRELAAHGEDNLVERKRQPPAPPGLGAEVASFANTLGGWLLVGVDDDGTAVGYDKPAKTDLQSHFGDLLRAQVDPLPPYVAAWRDLDGRRIAVIRVFQSADAPHIVRGTGALYVRSSKGKEPIDDHRTLLELARRGEEAEERARTRIAELPVVGHVLWTPDAPAYSGPEFRDDSDARVIARAAPVTVTPSLAAWPLTRRAANWCTARVDQLLEQRAPYGRQGPYPEAFARAIVVRLSQDTGGEGKDQATIVADSGGVLGVELRRGAFRADSPNVTLSALLDDNLIPLAATLSDMLVEAEGYGRAIVDLWLLIPPKGDIAGRRREIPRALYASRDLTVPAGADEVQELAHSWHRELQRAIGIIKFEGESSTG